jgi:prophage regulatory protein
MEKLRKGIVTMRPACLSLDDAARAVALSPSVLKKLVREKRFPAPRQLSQRRVGWLVRELEKWCKGRPVSDTLPLPRPD